MTQVVAGTVVTVPTFVGMLLSHGKGRTLSQSKVVVGGGENTNRTSFICTTVKK